jgi:hypothetical protein
LAKSTNYEAPRYAAFSTLPSLYPSSLFPVPKLTENLDSDYSHPEDGGDVLLRNVCSNKQPHCVFMPQKTAFLIVTAVKTPNLTAIFSSSIC